MSAFRQAWIPVPAFLLLGFVFLFMPGPWWESASYFLFAALFFTLALLARLRRFS